MPISDIAKRALKNHISHEFDDAEIFAIKNENIAKPG